MTFLGIGLFAGLITIILSLARDSALRGWVSDRRFEEAMEFASFSCKPHPIYPQRYLLWAGLVLVAVAFVTLYVTSSLGLVVGSLVLGMVLFLFYDFSGSQVRTEVTILPEGLLFESSKAELPRFLMPFSNIESVEESPKGIILVLKRPKLANRLPINSSQSIELFEKVSSGHKSRESKK